MKHFNFLSNLLSLSLGSPCTDVSLDRRFTVGSPSGLDAKWKQNPFMRFAVVLTLIFTIGIGNVWGQAASQAPANGSTYVVTYYTNSKYYAIPNTTGTGITLAGTQVTVNASGQVTSDNPPTWTLEEGTGDNAGKYYLKFTSGGNTYYLYKNGTSSSNKKFAVSSSRNYWSFASSGTGYTATAVGRGTNKTKIGYESNAFCCSGTAVVLRLLPVVPTGPTITKSSSMTTLTYENGCPVSQSFTVGGTNLTHNVTVTAPTDYEVCLTENGTYTSSVELSKGSGTLSNTTVYIRLQSGLSAGNIASRNISLTSEGATTQTIAVTGSVPYTITWMANGNSHATTYVAVGGTLALPATNPVPNSCGCTGKAFYGWYGLGTSYSNASVAPTIAAAGDAVSADKTYYAIFADVEEGEEGTVEASWGSSSGWTASSTCGSSYWIFCSSSTLSSPTISDLSQITNISFKMRTYGSTSYNTIAIKTNDGTAIGSITTSSGSSWVDKSLDNSDFSNTLSGSGNIVFYNGGSNSSTNGPAIDDIVITYNSTTYSNYNTTCCTQLGSINGSFSLSSTGTSVTATVTTAGVGAYGDAANVSGYEFKLYTASAGGSASASYSTNSSAGTSHEFTGLTPLTDYWVTVRPIGDGSTYCNTTAESNRVNITTLCVAPDHVTVTGRWDRFVGETISLTATPYDDGDNEITTGITGYQWQKLVNSAWTNVSGANVSGATSANLQITSCTAENSGKYRCQITTGAGCTTASATATDGTQGFSIKVFILECYNDGTKTCSFTRTGDTQTGTTTLTLAANTAYTFKFHVDNIYYGNNASINEDITNYVFCNSSNGGNCASNFTINSGLGGTFTLGIDYSSAGGNSSVEGEPELSITYPRKTIYLTPGDWNADGAKFALYYFRDAGGSGWTDFITADDCGSSTEIPQWNGVKINAVRLKNTCTSPNWDDKWNQTSNITITSNNSVSITGMGGGGDSPYTYGNYAVPTYTISYAKGSTTYTGGNTITGSKDSETKTCGVDFTLPSSAVFSATGYTQTGWTTSDGGSKTHNLGGDYTTNAAQAFYPAWTANTHSLSWSANGGDALTGDYTSGTVAYGTAITAPNTPTWTGHTFNGWHNGSSIVTPATTMPDNDLSYTAQWSLASYDVTLNVNGGTINAGNVTSYTYGTGATLPTNVTRDGYRFDGWFSDDGVWSDQVTAISTTATGDKTYYAKWTAIYTVTWHVNGSVYNTGVVSGNSQVISGGKISAPPTAPADNTLSACADKFMGWSAKNGGSDAKTTSYYDDLFTDVAGSPYITSNKDFYAVFAENNEETKSLTNSEIQTFHTADATTHNSYAKGPFTLTSSDGNWYGVFISQNDGGVYTANVKEAVVTLESTSEEVRPYIMSPTYSDNINSISILATHGSNTSRTLYVCSAATATPASNNIGSITVTKNNSTPQEIIPSSTATTLYLYAAGGAIMIKSIDVSIGSPSNYRTQCDANMVKVTYDANGGSTTCAGGSHDKRNDYTVCSSAPTKDYYSFAGWLCSADDKVYAASATIDDAVIDADFSLTAQWTPVTYNITYNLHGGTTAGGNPTTYDVETATIDLADGTYGHNRFEGWYSTYNDGTGAYSDQVTSIPLGSHGDITLHAKWTTRHEIIFDADGATTTIYRADDEAMDASVAGQGSVPSDPSAPSTCSTKVFVGWSESEIDDETNTRPGDLMKPAEGKVDEDKHYYAVWALRAGSPAPATYAGTGTFVKITSMSEVETDTYYVLRGINGSTVKVMKNTISSSKMGTADDPVSENVITNPGVAIVWKLGGKKDAYTLYNQSVNKYVEITANATGGYALNASPTAGATYTLTIEEGHGFFFKSNYSTASNRGISIYDASEFRSYLLASANTLELYKLPAYTYSAYSTSCCETKVNLTHNSPEHGTVEFNKSRVGTCNSDKEVSLTITPDAGYKLTGWTVNTASGYADAKATSPAVVTTNNNSAAQNITLTFAQDANKNYDVTATFGLMTVESWTWTHNSAAIPDPFNLYVGQTARFDVAYTPAGVDNSKKTYTHTKEDAYINWSGAQQATYSTISGKASTGENTTPVTFTHADGPTTTVNVKVLPLPAVHFGDIVHGVAFDDVAATLSDNALSPTKTTPTHADFDGATKNTCEEQHLHLVGWIREDWPSLVTYLNGGAQPGTDDITGAGNDASGNAYFFTPGASINTQTFNGVTFYAVWAKVE